MGLKVQLKFSDEVDEVPCDPCDAEDEIVFSIEDIKKDLNFFFLKNIRLNLIEKFDANQS